MAKRWPLSVSVSMMTGRFLSPFSVTKMDLPPMPSSGFTTILPCSAANAVMSAALRVISVGAQHCGNHAVNTFSFMSRRPCGRFATNAPCDLGALEDVGGVDVFGVERRILAHEHAVEFAQLLHARARRARTTSSGSANTCERPAAAERDAIAQEEVRLLEIRELASHEPPPQATSQVWSPSQI